MPDFIGERICCQINANGDERIDRDEFVKFFLKAIMGNHSQKMQIAFKCFDTTGDDCITKEHIKLLLKNVPLYSGSYGISKESDSEANLYRTEIMN